MLSVRMASTGRWTILAVTALYLIAAGGSVLAQLATTEPAVAADVTTQPAARKPETVMADLRADSV